MESSYEGTLDVVVGTTVVDKAAKPRARLRAIGAALLALGSILGVAGAPKGSWAISVVVGILLLQIGTIDRTSRRRTVTQAKRVVVSKTGIEVEGRRAIEADSIARAFFQPREEERGTVRCVDRDGRTLFEAEVSGEEDALAFLGALGRDVSRQRLAYRVASPIGALPLSPLLGLVGSIAAAVVAGVATADHGWSVGLRIALAAAMALLPIILVGSTATLEVGVDGLLIGWFGTRRFVSYDDVQSVESAGADVRVVQKDGRSLTIGVPARNERGEVGLGRTLDRDAMVARIRQALAARATGAGSRELAHRMRRDGRRLPDWKEHVAAVTGGSYREAAAQEDDLWRVVEDPGAPEDARAAAAALLREGASDPTRVGPRLRVAADAVVSPRLRVALERCAADEADADDVSRALATFEDERERRARTSRG